MKDAPEGVTMKHDLRAAKARHLLHLRRLTNWPLGESGVYARLDWLAQCLSLQDHDDQPRFQLLVEDLADMYAVIHSTFDEFRPTFDAMYSPHPRHPIKVRRAARFHFQELATTTRFDVEDLTKSAKIIAQKFNTFPPLERQHSIALAALVCLKNALESLEEFAISQAAEVGHLLTDAAESRDQAQIWFAHFETMKVTTSKLNYAVESACVETERRIKADVSEKNKRPGYRVAKDLTPKVIALYCNERPGQKYEALMAELAEKYHAGFKTVSRRYGEAKKKNLLS